MNLETDNKIQKKGITLVIPNPCGNIKETKMKNSGVEWIGEIPDDWESIRLKYIYSTTKAKLPKQFYDDKNLTPYLSMDFIRDSINTEPVYAKDGDYCSEEDILILWDGSNAGEIVFNHPAGYAPSTTAILKKLSTQSLPVYDKFYLKALEDDLRRNTNGMGIPHVNGSYLNNSLFLLPPKSTQQRIASYLDKKCSKIEETIQNQQQVIEKLKAYKQSLITEAVTGKVKIENGKVCGKYESYKESRLKWLGDFKIPEKWSNIQVKSFVSIPVVDGPHESPELFDNGIPYISATAIENSKIDFSLKRGFISEKYCDECDKRYKPMRDDILMIKLGATTGQVAIVETDERFNIWVPLAAIRCNKNIALPKFIFYSFQSDYCLKKMEMSWTFGTQQTLGVSSIERLKIFLPNIETQKTIADYLDKKCTAIDTAIEQKQNLIEKLTEYKKSLIYECVTGKKEI